MLFYVSHLELIVLEKYSIPNMFTRKNSFFLSAVAYYSNVTWRSVICQTRVRGWIQISVITWQGSCGVATVS